MAQPSAMTSAYKPLTLRFYCSMQRKKDGTGSFKRLHPPKRRWQYSLSETSNSIDTKARLRPLFAEPLQSGGR
jgi:hypothetical protein